jgi:hypothetical protein
MLKRYTIWLWLAVAVLFLAGLIHSVSLFISPVPANEVEGQMIELMTHYKMDMGAGFHRTMWDLLTALSVSLTFLCLLGGLTIGYLLKMKAPLAILKGIVRIHLLIFAVYFVVVVVFAFLLPVILIGLLVLFLAIGMLTIPNEAKAASET